VQARRLNGGPRNSSSRSVFGGPIVEEKANALRIRTWTGSVHNRPRGWVAPQSTMRRGPSPCAEVGLRSGTLCSCPEAL